MAELFGFNITRVKPQTDPKQQFSQPAAEDGTQVVAAGGFFGSYLDMEGTAKTEQDLIRRYREIALHPECDMAIEDIVNEAITSNENKQSVKVITDGLDYSSAIKVRIEEEFADVLRLLQFNTRGHDLFRRWYVDGRIFFQKVIDRENSKKGITELKYIDPRKIKKIREVRKKRPDTPMPSSLNSLAVVDEYIEYFLYNERGLSGTTGHGSQTRNIGAVMNKGVEIELDADVLKLGDFTWNLYGNYATLDNEVTRLATDAAGNDINLDGGIQRTRVGESIGNWYMRHYYPTVNPDNGKARYYTSAEDPTLTESYAAASQQLAGERIPTYSGGLGTRVTFRGFYADANFYFAGGNKVYEYYANYTQASGLYSTLYYNANEILMDRWQKPGDITRVPKMEYSYSSTVVGASTSTRFLYDADFVRLRDVAIVCEIRLTHRNDGTRKYGNMGISYRILSEASGCSQYMITVSYTHLTLPTTPYV